MPSTITLTHTTSLNPDFQMLIKLLDADLDGRYGHIQLLYNALNIIEYIETVVIAYKDGEAVGCACFKAFDGEAVEVKRMFVKEAARGKGIAAMILQELETWAASLGYAYTVLETGDKQDEAIRLYERAGYVYTENYGPYIGLEYSICMSKQLL